jgi:hypothetical protein
MEALNKAIDAVSDFRLFEEELVRDALRRSKTIYDQPRRAGENRKQFRARVRAERGAKAFANDA